MTGFVDIHGNPVSIEHLAAQAKRKPKATSSGPEPSHMGWRVVGHPAGACAAAHEENIATWRRWNAHDGEARNAAIARGERAPDMWDENLWRICTKKHNINGRTYWCLQYVAEQFAELARKAGWEDVEVIEFKKGSQE